MGEVTRENGSSEISCSFKNRNYVEPSLKEETGRKKTYGCCATILINGHQIKPWNKTCWCQILNSSSDDKSSLMLGRSVCQALKETPLVGPDGARLLLIEYRI